MLFNMKVYNIQTWIQRDEASNDLAHLSSDYMDAHPQKSGESNPDDEAQKRKFKNLTDDLKEKEDDLKEKEDLVEKEKETWRLDEESRYLLPLGNDS